MSKLDLRELPNVVTISALMIAGIFYLNGIIKLRTVLLIVCSIGVVINYMFKRFRNYAFGLSSILIYTSLVLHGIWYYVVSYLGIEDEVVVRAVDLSADILSMFVLDVSTLKVSSMIVSNASDLKVIDGCYTTCEAVWTFTFITMCILIANIDKSIVMTQAKVILCLIYILISRVLVLSVERKVLKKESQVIKG